MLDHGSSESFGLPANRPFGLFSSSSPFGRSSASSAYSHTLPRVARGREVIIPRRAKHPRKSTHQIDFPIRHHKYYCSNRKRSGVKMQHDRRDQETDADALLLFCRSESRRRRRSDVRSQTLWAKTRVDTSAQGKAIDEYLKFCL